jgi:hypothetical protein
LQRFCTAFSIHKAVLVQLDRTDGNLRATHQWTQGEVTPNILATAAEDYPWLASKIMSGELIVLEDIEDAPPEATNTTSNIFHGNMKEKRLPPPA